MKKSDVFAVFKVKVWLRDFRPIEIFYSFKDANEFISKNSSSFLDEEGDELKVYIRDAGDWKIFKEDT